MELFLCGSMVATIMILKSQWKEDEYYTSLEILEENQEKLKSYTKELCKLISTNIQFGQNTNISQRLNKTVGKIVKNIQNKNRDRFIHSVQKLVIIIKEIKTFYGLSLNLTTTSTTTATTTSTNTVTSNERY
jgi:hypothetical protein